MSELRFPTAEQVDVGTAYEVMRWNRFLPSPRTENEVEILQKIVVRLRGFSQTDRTAASKAVGWDK